MHVGVLLTVAAAVGDCVGGGVVVGLAEGVEPEDTEIVVVGDTVPEPVPVGVPVDVTEGVPEGVGEPLTEGLSEGVHAYPGKFTLSRNPPGDVVASVGARSTRTVAVAPPHAVMLGVAHAPPPSTGTACPLRKSRATPVPPNTASVPWTPHVSTAGTKVAKNDELSPGGEEPSVRPSTSTPGGAAAPPTASSDSGAAHGPPGSPTRYAQGALLLGHAAGAASAAAAAPGVQFTTRIR